MSKPFSQMSATEKAENRRRLALGLPADWTDETDAMKMTAAEFAARKADLARDTTRRRETAAATAFVESLKGRFNE